MEKGNLFGKMGLYMKEILISTQLKEKENMYGQMGLSMKEM